MRRWLAAAVSATLLGVIACSPPPPKEPAPVQKPAEAPMAPEGTAELVETVPRQTKLGSKGVIDTHEAWLAMIEGATESIDIGQFYAAGRNGPERFDAIADALRSAVDRGVKVRVLVDALFSAKYAQSIARLKRSVTVEVTRAWQPDGVQHAKYLVVDGRETYVGSANLDWRSLTHIHEIGLQISSEALGADVADLFARDLRLAEGQQVSWGDAVWERVPLKSGGTVRLVATPAEALPDASASALEALVAALDGAKDRIAIQLLDYATTGPDGPFPTLDQAIRRAAGRGVHVRVLLSNWQQNDMVAVKALHQLERVEVALVTVPRARSGFIPFARVIHAKYAAFDGRVGWIGSSNWKGEYFHQSRNLGVIIEDSPLVEELERIFGEVWLSGYADLVDVDRRYEAPRIE